MAPRFLWALEYETGTQLTERALSQVEILLQIYERRNKHEQMAGLQRQLYERATVTLGKFDIRTIDYAHRLIKGLFTLHRHHEVGDLCEELLLDMRDEIDVWDRRQLGILFHLIESYDRQGQQLQAETELRSAWQTLHRATVDEMSLEARFAFVQVSVRLGKCLITGFNYLDASEIATKLWGVLADDTSPWDEATRRELLTLSDSCIQAGLFEPVIPVLVELRSIYPADLSIDTYVAAVRISILLSKCYRHHPHRGDGTALLLELVEILLSMDMVDEHCIDVVVELVDHYKERPNWHGAAAICDKVLERVWPELCRWEDHEPTVAEVPTESGLRMGLVYARLVVSQSSKDEAAGVLRFLFTSFRDSDRVGEMYVVEAADLYSDVLRDAGRIPEAIDVLQSLHTYFPESYGSRHEQSGPIAEKLVDLYRVTDIRNVSEEILLDIVEGFGPGEGLCQSTGFHAVLVLIQVYEAKDRPTEMRTWYERLWGALMLYRGAGDITDEQLVEVLQKYSSLLLLHHQRAEAIQITRELRTLVSRDSLWLAHVDYELATLLEGDHEYREAVDLYEEICRRGMEVSGEQQQIPRVVSGATERLSRLYAQHASLADRAEEMLRRAWHTALRIRGCSDDHTVTCFHQLMAFYGQEGSRTVHAWAAMQEYLVQILIEELDEERLYDWAWFFSKLYHQFGDVNPGLQLLHDVRVERAFLRDRSGVPASRIGEARLLMVDRRSFILVNTLEALLLGRPQGPVLRDIIQEVLTESALYEVWANIKRVNSSLQTALTVSSRLIVFLQERGRKCEADALRQEAWTMFQQHTQPDLPQSGAVWAFFNDCLHELHQRQPTISLVTSLVNVCIELKRRESFTGCFTLAQWAREYLTREGWGSQSKDITRLGFQLVQAMRSDEAGAVGTLPGDLRELTEELIIGLVYRGRRDWMDVTGLSLGEVNIVIRFLSDQNDIDSLEVCISLVPRFGGADALMRSTASKSSNPSGMPASSSTTGT